MRHITITDRGSNWEQLRWQINSSDAPEGWEDSEDTLELALAHAEHLNADKITILNESYFQLT